MKKFIKYMFGSLDNASRNKRELSVVSKFNCDVIVFSFGTTDQSMKKIDGYTICQRTNTLSKVSLIRKFQIVFNWLYKEPMYLRRKQANCISCHNLTALFIGWLSTWFISKNKKPKLVYDSHEFEIGCNTEGKRGEFAKFIIPRLEKFLMNKCAFSIMVNDSIADEVQRIHKLEERPVVVRNIPNYWTIDKNICQKKKQEFCEQLGIPIDTFIVMYHGVVMPGRGIETLLLSVQKNNNIAAIILGNGKENYIEKLKQNAIEMKISQRVLFHKAVPLNDLWQYVGAADLGMVTVPAICKSYYFMLPNKLFENIQSLTPIIGSDFPETSKIIKGYDIGLCVNPDSVVEIVEAIEEIRLNKDMYNRFKINLKQAKEELCWENESKILEKAYDKILK